MARNRELEAYKKIEELREKLKGKTIEDIGYWRTWRRDEVENMTIFFTDGTNLQVDCNSDKGCNECDPIGSAPTYLDPYLSERKDGDASKKVGCQDNL